MIRITIDDEQKKKLLDAEGIVELYDEAGKIVGQATPLPQKTNDPWSLFPELTAEEIERRCNEPGEWLSTEEAIAYIKDRGNRK